MRHRNNYFLWGLTALCVISASLLLGLTLYNFRTVMSAGRTLVRILMPFIWGFAIAYMLLPVFNFNIRWMEPCLLTRAKSRVKAKGQIRLAASILTVVWSWARCCRWWYHSCWSVSTASWSKCSQWRILANSSNG